MCHREKKRASEGPYRSFSLSLLGLGGETCAYCRVDAVMPTFLIRAAPPEKPTDMIDAIPPPPAQQRATRNEIGHDEDEM